MHVDGYQHPPTFFTLMYGFGGIEIVIVYVLMKVTQHYLFASSASVKLAIHVHRQIGVVVIGILWGSVVYVRSIVQGLTVDVCIHQSYQ